MAVDFTIGGIAFVGFGIVSLFDPVDDALLLSFAVKTTPSGLWNSDRRWFAMSALMSMKCSGFLLVSGG